MGPLSFLSLFSLFFFLLFFLFLFLFLFSLSSFSFSLSLSTIHTTTRSSFGENLALNLANLGNSFVTTFDDFGGEIDREREKEREKMQGRGRGRGRGIGRGQGVGGRGAVERKESAREVPRTGGKGRGGGALEARAESLYRRLVDGIERERYSGVMSELSGEESCSVFQCHNLVCSLSVLPSQSFLF